MKKMLFVLLAAVALALILGSCHLLREKEAVTVASATVPAQSVPEFVQQYKNVELTASQRKLVAAGLDPFVRNSVTVNQ